MIAIIKGDIISSRKINNPELWLLPLKKLFNEWGTTPEKWELVWGDSFQLEVDSPTEALRKALLIKTLIRKIGIDVRMAIGIGKKTYAGTRISESNGEVFIYAGEKFEELEKEKSNLLIKSPWPDFDEEMNLYLRLASVFMDNWTAASAELVEMVLREPSFTQKEIGTRLGIKQNSVSGRWKRAHVDELLAVEKIYRKKMEKLQS
jgi:predicted XRE-type DNA-binding protein